MDYRISQKHNNFNSIDFTCYKSSIKDIKAKALEKLKSLPEVFSTNGDWKIVELNSDVKPLTVKKFITTITV